MDLSERVYGNRDSFLWRLARGEWHALITVVARWADTAHLVRNLIYPGRW
jgi:hypothetical protein